MPRFKTRNSPLRRQWVADQVASLSLLLLAAIALATALSYLRMPLIPFVLAVFLTYLIAPMVDLFQTRLHLPRWCALGATFVLTFSAVALLGLFVLLNFQRLLASADVYQARILQLAADLSLWAQRNHIPIDEATVMQSIREFPFFSTLTLAAGRLVHLLTSGLLVLIFLFFLIMGSGPASGRLGVYAEIDRQIRQYLTTKIATSAACGILVGIALAFLKVELAFMFGLLTFLLNFIPTLGAIIATLLPLPVVLLQSDNPLLWLAVVLIPGGIQGVIGNFIEPKLLSDSLDLHPASVVLALTFWGIIWGPVGMFLAVPIVVVIKIVLERITLTRPLAELLAGRLPGHT